jgi:hypothetical protein
MPPGKGGNFDDELLDDPRRLEATDSGGLLRAAATAGAQVRATAAAAQEAGLDQLGGQRPRALVLLTRPGAAPAAAPLATAIPPTGGGPTTLTSKRRPETSTV